ncbi:hypothetical protein RJ639_045863 [Escallonia herrerae]|uniref:Reverse transcriptase Ty1/copia-type domain-containing protein n=1 Tax=Escallonia herrerae TaxID=1293975 RepID=A0AA88W959_9ASTE|nr:hypothetical protein RJ639_045863 [Escallonia herrerae]
MEEELNALPGNEIWDVVPSQKEVAPTGCKWEYTLKMRSEGYLHSSKACPIALGHKQEYGIDYSETFAPVAKMTSSLVFLNKALLHFMRTTLMQCILQRIQSLKNARSILKRTVTIFAMPMIVHIPKTVRHNHMCISVRTVIVRRLKQPTHYEA